MATGGGATYLMTRVIDKSGTLDPPVRVRRWNGAGFDAPHVLPIPGTGDDSKFALAVDGSGRLHAVWVGSREDYRLWHSVSSNGGRTWHATLLGDAASSPRRSTRSLTHGASASPWSSPRAPARPSSSRCSSRRRSPFPSHNRTVFTAHVSPVVPGHLVSLQRLHGKRWTTVADAHETRTGAVTFSAGSAAGRADLVPRVVSGQYGTYDIGSSRVVTVRG